MGAQKHEIMSQQIRLGWNSVQADPNWIQDLRRAIFGSSHATEGQIEQCSGFGIISQSLGNLALSAPVALGPLVVPSTELPVKVF